MTLPKKLKIPTLFTQGWQKQSNLYIIWKQRFSLNLDIGTCVSLSVSLVSCSAQVHSIRCPKVFIIWLSQTYKYFGVFRYISIYSYGETQAFTIPHFKYTKKISGLHSRDISNLKLWFLQPPSLLVSLQIYVFFYKSKFLFFLIIINSILEEVLKSFHDFHWWLFI